MSHLHLIAWKPARQRPTVTRLGRRTRYYAKKTAQFLAIGALIAIGFMGTLYLVQAAGHANTAAKPVSTPAPAVKPWRQV